MPATERRNRRQKALLWAAGGVDNWGDYLRAPGGYTEIRVRWIDTQEEALDSQGNVLTIDATIIVGVIDVPIGSIMWKGGASDLLAIGVGTGTGIARIPLSQLMQVKVEYKTPALKGRGRFLRKYGLMRYRETINAHA